MLQRVRSILSNLGFYVLWGIVGAAVALVAYQLYVMLLFIGLLMVENPATRPPAWNTQTIYGLGRFLILVLGALWLLAVSFLEGYLREGIEQQRLRARILRLALCMGALYGIIYGVFFLLSR